MPNSNFQWSSSPEARIPHLQEGAGHGGAGCIALDKDQA